MDQLEHILDGADVVLSQECLDDLNAAHKAHQCPIKSAEFRQNCAQFARCDPRLAHDAVKMI